jgi:2-polyprenyl-3-methyl-5-hydroxy-6-metoxy-1,4-benzoquinol methylase
MNGEELLLGAQRFKKRIDKLKSNISSDFPWYPYGTQNNFIHLKSIFDSYPLDTLVSTKHIADIGAADGDLAFFMESLGFRVDIIDFAPTNFNGLRGARKLVDALGANERVHIHEMDIDAQFKPPASHYDLVFFLGILYHLKNPFYVLEQLSKISSYLLLSTRVARFAPDGTRLTHLSIAYLLAPEELNNDATNYWIFTETSLRRIVTRAGWDILSQKAVGDVTTSNPCDNDKDERAFLLLRSRSI